MKILQINAVYGSRSTGLIVRDIENAIKLSGGEARVAYQEATTPPKDGYKIGNAVDLKAHALLSRIFGKQAYFSRRATKGLVRYIERERPDVVHLHNLHSNYVHLNLLLAYLAERDIPTVITMHDCWYFTGKCYHFADVGCEKFVTGCGNCPKKHGTPHTLFFDTSKKVYADRRRSLLAIPRLKIVGCSDWICNEARRGFLKDADVSRIYNGTDTSEFCPKERGKARARYGIANDAFVVMGMANKWLLCENEELLNGIAQTLSSPRRLVIVGCTAEQKRMLGRYPYVLAMDYVSDREKLAELFSAADVFVNPTHADTLPTVNMEASACGTPVITYDACGSPELVRDGVTGFVVREGDVNGVLAAIERVRSGEISPDACREVAVNDFDKNVNYRKYVELYEKITHG